MKLLLNFIPIIIIFLLVTYSNEIAEWSHTILGKLFAVFLIIFYTKMDVLSGLLVTALVILYYQSDYVEGFSNLIKKEGFLNIPFITLPEIDADLENQEDTEINVSLELLEDAYPDKITQDIIYDPQVSKFRQKNCSKGHLVHKGQIIKPEIAEHVFPEIEMEDFHKCNICDYTCDFNFIDKKIKIQDDIMKPRSAR